MAFYICKNPPFVSFGPETFYERADSEDRTTLLSRLPLLSLQRRHSRLTTAGRQRIDCVVVEKVALDCCDTAYAPTGVGASLAGSEEAVVSATLAEEVLWPFAGTVQRFRSRFDSHDHRGVDCGIRGLRVHPEPAGVDEEGSGSLLTRRSLRRARPNPPTRSVTELVISLSAKRCNILVNSFCNFVEVVIRYCRNSLGRHFKCIDTDKYNNCR